MTDYIPRKTAIMAVGDYEKLRVKHGMVTPEKAETVLIGLPAADVVEVVRCKDCIWFEPDSVWNKGEKIRYREEGKFVSAEEGVNVQSYCECPRWWHLDGLMFVTKEHYCAHGERREDG